VKGERKRRALGKGLGSLIPESPEATREGPGAPGVVEVAIERIDPNPHQPRRHFDDEQLAALADSIRSTGVLQPLLLRPEPDGGYTLIAGERRLRAARLAGLPTVPAVVRPLPDARLLEFALVENIQRDDLAPLETARAFRVLIREYGLTQAEAAQRVGKPRSTVANFLRLLDLAPAAQQLLDEGRLEMGHGRALAGLEDPVEQERIARQAAERGWSVRQVEQAVRRQAAPPTAAERAPRRDPNIAAAETVLGRSLGARIRIRAGRGGRGRIEIGFADEEDLDRLYRLLLRHGGAGQS
jgi:ParB family chromosome partitioning protein